MESFNLKKNALKKSLLFFFIKIDTLGYALTY
jgi:hypothetical protein